jgi:4-alpha-glucanotransferase
VSDERPWLAALAEKLGISASYWDLTGRSRPTSDATREVLVRAMGHDSSSEESAARALTALERAEGERLLDPVRVWRDQEPAVPNVALQVPRGLEEATWHLALHEEGGGIHEAEGRLSIRNDERSPRRVLLPLPASPLSGYHEVRVRVEAGGATAEGLQRFVMAPRTALRVEEALPGGRGFGLWANLYTVRSRSNWGFGDASDLASLLEWCAAVGGAFVGVNPLHAIPSRGLAITPYSPTSRVYRNVLYLDVETVPELDACPAARALLADPDFRLRLGALRAGDAIDHAVVRDAKLEVLRLVFEGFLRKGGAAPRAPAFARYCAREGRELRDFATWEVLAERLGSPTVPATDWMRWPEALRDPRAPAVETFRREHADEVLFRQWLQFELDAQLARAASRGRAAGLPVGVYQDLAVGSAPDSADTWMEQQLFAEGVSVGAPPDDYAPDGQNWGFPPLDPHRLRADGYRFWTRLLRAGFAHAGALRIDHAMGMMRLFWIPHGRSGSDGTYVRYPLEDLFGILALESRRAGALVIAEDLGTVPPEFRERMADWSVLGSAVAYFERDGGEFRPASAYPTRALATVETHDLVPLAGHRDGHDLVIRRRVGQIPDDASFDAARSARRADHEALLGRLRADGLLAPEGEPDAATLCAALHAFLAASPAALVAASLDDLAGETEPVNVPGVSVEQHRSWSRRMARALESLREDPRVAAALAPLAAARGCVGPHRPGRS